MTDWQGMQQGFEQRVAEGYVWQQWLARRWTEMGLPTVCNKLSISPSFAENHKHTDAWDCRTVQAGHVIEVKALKVGFFDPPSFPYRTVLVGRASSWEGRPTPLVVALISKPTESVIVIPGASRKHWKPITVFDSDRQYEAPSWACPKCYMVHEAVFIAAMLRRGSLWA